LLAIDHATPRIRDGSRRPDEEEKKRQETGDRSDYIEAVSSGQGQIADGSQVAAGRGCGLGKACRVMLQRLGH
jgi:hypothetical protein